MSSSHLRSPLWPRSRSSGLRGRSIAVSIAVSVTPVIFASAVITTQCGEGEPPREGSTAWSIVAGIEIPECRWGSASPLLRNWKPRFSFQSLIFQSSISHLVRFAYMYRYASSGTHRLHHQTQSYSNLGQKILL
jgi:hypothetical protein